MIPLDTLIVATTEDQVVEKILSVCETIGLPARSWRKGGALRTILRVIASLIAAMTSLVAAFARGGFLELATGPWLSLLAFYVYGITRRDATFATGSALFTNAGGGIYDDNPIGSIRVLGATGKAYVNDEVFSLSPGDTKLVKIRAVEIGSASTAAPGTITTLETVLAGVSVTNPNIVAGLDAESDPELRQGCRDMPGTLSGRGPRAAYRYAVRVATRTDGSPVNVNRTSISKSSSTGTVTMYLAAPSGAPDSTDIAAVEDAVETWARPDTVTFLALPCTEVVASRALTIWVRRTDGVSSEDIASLVANAITQEVVAYPIGGIPKPPAQLQGYFYADFLGGVAKGAHASIYDVDGTGDDIALAAGQILKLACTIDVRLVEAA